MKNKILKILLMVLVIPALLLTGCKKVKPLPAIDISTYLGKEITLSYFQLEPTGTKETSMLTEDKFVKENLGKYTKIELYADPIWMYKMYIESVSFYVYTTTSSITQMIVNLSITNVADEETLKTTTSEAPKVETATEQCTFIPEAGTAVKCTFNIGKAVAKATGATITIDILNSLELFDETNPDGTAFEWTIYGFEIHGESRAYSKI